jgi:hypothetical protein
MGSGTRAASRLIGVACSDSITVCCIGIATHVSCQSSNSYLQKQNVINIQIVSRYYVPNSESGTWDHLQSDVS